MKRAMVWGGTSVVLLLGVALVLVYQWRSSIIERAIESYGSAALGAAVHVDAVELEAKEGRATIRGLRVTNPDGFSAQDAFAFDEVTLRIDPTTLLDDLIVVREVRVLAPHARLELTAAGASNLEQLQDNAARGGRGAASDPSGSRAGSGGEASAPGSGAAESRLRIRIDRVSVAGGELVADLSAVGEDERSLALPTLEIPQIGGPGGAPPAELAQSAAVAWTRHLQRTAVRASIMGKLEELIDDDAGDALGDVLRGVLEAR